MHRWPGWLQRCSDVPDAIGAITSGDGDEPSGTLVRILEFISEPGPNRRLPDRCRISLVDNAYKVRWSGVYVLF